MPIVHPKSMGDNQVLREDFISRSIATDNGWEIVTGSTISAGKLNVAAKKYFIPNFFWTIGGTIRLRVQFNDSDATLRRFFFLGKDANYLFQFYYQGNTSGAIFEIRNGSGNNYYTTTQAGSLTPGSIHEIVITWNPTTTTLTTYINGANAVSDTAASSQYAGSYDTEYNKIKIGTIAGGTGMTSMDTYCIEIYKSIWTASEVADSYSKSTYSEIDAGRSNFYLPLTGRYNDGTEKTKNLGIGGDLIVGDGSTSTTFPNGRSFDGGDYIRGVNNVASVGTMACIFTVSSVVSRFLMGAVDGSANRCYLGYNSSGEVSGGIGSVSNSTIKGGAWIVNNKYFACLTWDGTTVNLYQNDNIVYTGNQTGTLPTGLPLYIGCYNNNGLPASNHLGNLYIPAHYPFALTPRQVRFLRQKMFNNLNK